MNKPEMHSFIWVYKNSDESWFKVNSMGGNRLNSLMNTMAEKDGLENFHLTNTATAIESE